jgi:hypothetical protein
MRILPDHIANPTLIPILLAAFVPILLHFLDRRRARRVDWPAMRFLVLGSRSRLRRWQVREAFLIAVRSVVALLVAYAALGPGFRETAARKADGAPRAVAIAVDCSWSMDYRETPDGPSSLDRAREAALAVIESLSAASRVAVIAPGADSWALGTESPPAGAGSRSTGAGSQSPNARAQEQSGLLDPPAARRAIDRLRPGPGSFRLLTVLDRAASALSASQISPREVYVLTDLQTEIVADADAPRWRFVAERLRSGGSPGAPRAAVRIVDCGSEAPSNRFVVGLEPPLLSPTTDELAKIGATISVSGAPTRWGEPPDSGPPSVPVRLLEGGVEVESTEATPASGSPASIAFEHRFREAGPARVEVALPPDGLRGDDARRLVTEVLGRIDVLVCGPTGRGSPGGGSPGSDPGPLVGFQRRAADYVDLALLPRFPGTPIPDVIARPRVVGDLGGVDLSPYRVVVLAGPESVGPREAESLEVFVAAGGGLLAFLGPGVDAISWAGALHRGGRGLLPARPGIQRKAASPSVFPREIATSHPALSLFSGGDEGDLAATAIRRWTSLHDVARDATVLARVDAESPWIVEGRFGAGRVVLVATSAAPDDSDLPLTPLFLPLVHRLVRHLAARDPAALNVELGAELSLEAPVEVPFDGPRTAPSDPPRSARDPWNGTAEEAFVRARVAGPDGLSQEIPLDVVGGRPAAVFRGTSIPGFYELRLERERGRPIASRVFAVNVPQEESRLERVGKGVLEGLDPSLEIRTARNLEEVLETSVLQERVREGWPPAVAALVLLALLELAIARGFSRGA